MLLKGDLISQNADMYGEWAEAEIDLFRFLLPKNGHCIEVGSNIGMHAIPLSHICNEGQIYCFEPQRPIFHMLCANIALNNRLNIVAKHQAVGMVSTQIEIETSDYSQPWNYGSFSLEQGFSTEGAFNSVIKKDKIDVTTLDMDKDISSAHSISMIKVDVEGLEVRVLQGAQYVIEKHQPALFIEVNTAEHTATILNELKHYDYNAYWFFSSRFRPNNFNALPYSVNGYDKNIIFLPKSNTRLDGKLKPVLSVNDTDIPILTGFN